MLSSPLAMNSPQPSTTWLPMLAAWFRRHSRYLINGAEVIVVVVVVVPIAAIVVIVGGGVVLGVFDVGLIGVIRSGSDAGL